MKAATLADVRCLLVDMDGVLFRGSSPLPGSADFISFLARRNIRFRLLTNNSTKTPSQNAAMLAKMGIDVAAEQIYTSPLATAAYLLDQGAAGQTAYVIGEMGLRSALIDAGIRIVDSAEAAQWVVAGLDRQVTYERLARAAFHLEHGAGFVATNADTSLPIEGGLAPGAGALQAVLIATTGVRPAIIGKPDPRMLLLAMDALGAEPSKAAMLGDRLDTDIQAAEAASILSILVLTGVTRPEDLAASTLRPDVVVPDLNSLMDQWPGDRL